MKSMTTWIGQSGSSAGFHGTRASEKSLHVLDQSASHAASIATMTNT
jgi:hypothetical protein